jgi:hypothetical protein
VVRELTLTKHDFRPSIAFAFGFINLEHRPRPVNVFWPAFLLLNENIHSGVLFVFLLGL